MVIFDDLHKLLLYQRLNLGFECHVCNRKFYNRIDHLQHTRNCKSELLKCPKCGKMFGNQQILHLHLQFHNLSEHSSPPPKDQSTKCKDKPVCVELLDSDDDDDDATKVSHFSNGSQEKTGSMVETEAKSLLESRNTSFNVFHRVVETQDETCSSAPIRILESPKKQSSQKAKVKPKTVKKRIGLTKVKMEDCLRCDACSCIYIDEKDYYKHMRNFHQLDVNNLPIPQQKPKKKCRSCCKQCRGTHCTPVKRPRATQRASNLIFKINMRDNIQDRWTRMVSQQLNECPNPHTASVQSTPEVYIKPDPDSVTVKPDPEPTLDLSYLLSQVEVKIKTEPADDYFT